MDEDVTKAIAGRGVGLIFLVVTGATLLDLIHKVSITWNVREMINVTIVGNVLDPAHFEVANKSFVKKLKI